MERERNVRKIAVSFLVISILCLSVAFAMLSRKLSIAGSAKLDPTKWGVKFVEGTLKVDSSSTAAIDSTPIIKDNVTISNMNFTFNKPGDKVIYTVDIENESDINVIAKVNDPIKNGDVNDEDIQKVITFSLKYKDTDKDVDNTVLEKNTRVTLVITFNYDRDIIDKAMLNRINEKYPTGLTLSLNTLTLTFTQSNELANITTTTSKVKPETCLNFNAKDSYAVGDVVSFCNYANGKSEDFNVLAVDDTNDEVTLFAMHNLVVEGGNTNYGLQATDLEIHPIAFAEKKEYKKINGEYVGYWRTADGSHFEEGYDTDNIYDENSLLFNPVKNYANYIKETFNITNISGRILTFADYRKIGCDKEECLVDWVHTTRYWYSYGVNINNVGYIDTDGTGLWSDKFYEVKNGVRPIIIVKKSELLEILKSM